MRCSLQRKEDPRDPGLSGKAFPESLGWELACGVMAALTRQQGWKKQVGLESWDTDRDEVRGSFDIELRHLVGFAENKNTPDPPPPPLVGKWEAEYSRGVTRQTPITSIVQRPLKTPFLGIFKYI